MNTKRTTRWIAVAAVAVAATWVTSSTVAQMSGFAGDGMGTPEQRQALGGPHGPGGPGGFAGGGGFAGPGCRLEALAEELDLTTEQQGKIEQIREQGEPKRIELRKQLMRLRHELAGVMIEDEPDRSAAVQLAMKIGDARTKLQVHGLEQRLAMRQVLTAEQRDRLMTIGPRLGRRLHGGRGGHGSGHGGGPGGSWDGSK